MAALTIVLFVVLMGAIGGGLAERMIGLYQQRRDRPRPKGPYPQHVYTVGTPTGQVRVDGYMRCYHQGSGVLTFLDANGFHTTTFGPNGWTTVQKTGEVATEAVQP